MKKGFLYLYPFEPYFNFFLKYYEEEEKRNAFAILNACIEKRYRDRGYQIYFLLYPDMDIYGIVPESRDKLIYTDVTFEEASVLKERNTFTSPSLEKIYRQLENLDILRVGGFHFNSCVKETAEYALSLGIDTLVDLDLTDLFFNHYDLLDYFDIASYEPERFMEDWFKEDKFKNSKKQFLRYYKSPVYGMPLDKL